MTLKLTKILVSLLVMNPLKEMVRPQTIWNTILSFGIKIFQKSCKHWKQLQKVFVSIVKNHIVGVVSTLQVLVQLPNLLHDLPFTKHPSKSTLQISTSTFECIFFAWNENRMYVQSVVTQLASMIDFYHFFREKRLWKIVAALSLSMEFSSRRKKPFTRLQSNYVWEIWFRAFL